MFLPTHKNYSFQISQKINPLGLRVETGPQIEYGIKNDKLRLTDNWNIQIVYSPPGKTLQTTPSLLEFPVVWEDEFDWKKEYPSHLTVTYKKVPRSVTSHILQEEQHKYFLHLTLEALIEIDFAGSVPPKSNSNEKADDVTIEQNIIDNDPIDIKHPVSTSLLEKITSLEGRSNTLLLQIKNLEAKIKDLEKTVSLIPLVSSKIAGTVLDDFRMIPVPKCILEFYQNDQKEPSIKLATDARGYYSCTQLAPGIYEIRIKHPRYQPLIIKDFAIHKEENKYQDFLLRRA